MAENSNDVINDCKDDTGSVSAKSLAWVGVSLASLISVDQWTKVWADSALKSGKSIKVIPGFFDFSLAYNSGAAFSFGARWPEFWRKFVFLGLSSLAVVFLLWLLYQALAKSRWTSTGLTLIIGGAIGNLIDRFRLGYVIDFIHWFYKDHHWPNFNVADSCICVGIGIMIWHMLFVEHRGKQAAKESP